MIVKAVRNGVKPERIAKALSMPMSIVSGLINLLDDINLEAAELLKDKHMTADAIGMLLAPDAVVFTSELAADGAVGTRTDVK
jgi:hypothetical protein